MLFLSYFSVICFFIKNYICLEINYYMVIIMVSMEEFPISSANFISGYKIVENKGFVYGLTVRARGIGGDIGAGLKGLLGGEIKQYVTMMEDSREESIQRCIEHAKNWVQMQLFL